MQYIKHFIKKYFQFIWLKNKFSAQTQIAQRQLFNFYQVHKDKLQLSQTGFSVFSQFEEDGLILFILAVIGIKNSNFIEIGSDDGLNSNCANLALNFGWYGLFIDANQRSISRGEYFYRKHPNPFGYKPRFCLTKVTRENINEIIESNGFRDEIDLLSIDIDGNDYWIWDAIHVINPRIVMIETHINFGLRDIVVPYDPNYVYPGKHPQYHGASPIAMVKLGRKKGYRLIGANMLGFNFIFLRNDLGVDHFPEVTVESVLWHPSAKNVKLDLAIEKYPFETPP